MMSSVYVLSALMIFGSNITPHYEHFTSKQACEHRRDVYKVCVEQNKSIDKGLFGSACMLDETGEYKITKDCEELKI